MKQIICAFILGFFSLNSSAQGKIKISGQVQNPFVTSVSISQLSNQELVSADLDENGGFSMSAKIEEGYYWLNYGRNTSYIYLYPKDDLTITFDAKYFDETLVFEGKGAERNNYLAKKSIEGAKLTEDLEAFYKQEEATYLKNIENVKQTHIASLNTYNVENFFKEEELKSLEYERLLSIQNFSSNYKFYLGEEIEPSDNFYESIGYVDLNNEEDYNKHPYYRYLANSIWNKQIDAASNVDGMLMVLRQVKSQSILVGLVLGFYSKISSSEDRAKDYLELIKRVTTHQPFIDAAEERYKEVLKSDGLKKGDPSPAFSYENFEGETVSLDDLKGKYVYIDVWATWCAPCIKQVPYLKKLEERYHDANIVFVSISVDKEELKSTWKQVIIDRELGGLQLFADKSFDSDFMNAYAVNSIPRFILIDPEGKIVDTEAPRPSFEKTRELLDSLLN